VEKRFVNPNMIYSYSSVYYSIINNINEKLGDLAEAINISLYDNPGVQCQKEMIIVQRD